MRTRKRRENVKEGDEGEMAEGAKKRSLCLTEGIQPIGIKGEVTLIWSVSQSMKPLIEVRIWATFW